MNADDVREERRRGRIIWDLIRQRLEDGRFTERDANAVIDHFREDGTLGYVAARRIAAQVLMFVDDQFEPRRNLEDVFEEAAEMEDWIERRGPPENTLQNIAADAQNVHRGPVSEQTNRMMKLLLETPPQRVDETFNMVFKGLKRTTFLDIRKWNAMDTCIERNDALYRQLLNGVVIRIHNAPSPVKEELIKRFQEEVTESVGTCCMGHITRLCNVLVGFDEAFQAQIPAGQMLQEKMAAISQRDASAEEKALDAWKAMDELHVPDAERAAWIDAL